MTRVTKRRRAPSVFNAGTAINVLAIPVITTVFIAGGFYFTVRSRLDQVTQEQKASGDSLKSESDARERLRSALEDYAGKTQHSVDQLAAHAMVQDEQIKAVNSSLERVVNGLQSIELAVGGGRAKK